MAKLTFIDPKNISSSKKKIKDITKINRNRLLLIYISISINFILLGYILYGR